MIPKDSPSKKEHSGWKEGVSRMLSQAGTYMIEVQKGLVQLHGNTQAKNMLTPIEFFNAYRNGVLQSSLTAGIVFGSYFHVYRSLEGQIYANAVATFTTSLIKIPISNCIRVIQLHPKENYNILSAGKRIFLNQGPRGLYSGYGLSYLEDYVEMDLREKIYKMIDHLCIAYKLPLKDHERGFIGGAISGASVAFLTTPFDMLKCQLIYQTGNTSNKVHLVSTISNIFIDKGIFAFYRGSHLRAMSAGIRMALFYMFLEVL